MIFGYDNLNRLRSIKLNNGTLQEIDYHENGNIKVKYDVGKYLYAENNHAVSDLENVTTGYSPQAFSLKHTSFDRTSQIEVNTKRHEFEYGYDKQRNISRYYENDNLKTTRYYIGSYEKEVTGSSNKEYDHINGPEGLTLIVTKTGNTHTILYTYRSSG